MSQSSCSHLKNTTTTSNIYQAADGDLDYSSMQPQVTSCVSEKDSVVLGTSDVIDLSTNSSFVSLQTTEETVISNEMEESTEERTSYEIAAEALCLMKSGGVKSLNERQKAVVAVSAGSQADISGSSFTLAQYDSDICYIAEPLVTLNGNTQSAVTLSNSQSQVNRYSEASIDSAAVVNVGSKLRTLTLPSDGSAESFSATQAQSMPISSTAEIVKYVLVPESALLSKVKPGEIVPVPGTPYFFMIPEEHIQSTKAQIAPQIPAQTQSHRQLQPKESVLTDSINLQVESSMAVNIRENMCASNESQNGEDQSQPTAKNLYSKRSTKKHDALKFPPCIICDGEASGFHYGCNTCEACKNFFRRCLLRKTNTPFICHSGKNCEISYKKNKNNCSACRLDKCLELGMAKEKCKMGRYTALMRTETIKKVRKLEGKDDENNDNSNEDSSGPVIGQEIELGQQTDVTSTASSGIRDIYSAMISRQIYSDSDHLPEQETRNEYNEKLVELLVQAMDEIKPWGEGLLTEESRRTVIKEHYKKYRAKVETFGQLSDVSMQEYQVLLRKFGIDIDGQWETFKQWTFDWEAVVGRYCTFAKHIPEFRALSFDDQACLLKATHFDFFLIMLHQGYIPEYGVFLEINGVPLHIEEAANKFFSRELVLAMTDLMSKLQKMKLNKAEMALLISIVTMSSDQCMLQNSTLVENTQLHLVDLLLRETNKMYGSVAGRKRFTTVIDILTKMRDVSNIYYKEYRALCEDDIIREAVPNLDCVLPDEH